MKREQAGDTLGFASALFSYNDGSQKEAFRGDSSQHCAELLPWTTWILALEAALGLGRWGKNDGVPQDKKLIQTTCWLKDLIH